MKKVCIVIVFAILLVLLTVLGFKIYEYKEAVSSNDEIGKIMIGENVPVYDTTIVLTEENLHMVDFVDPEHYDINNNKWNELKCCVCLHLESDLIKNKMSTPYMKPAFYVTFKYDYKGWKMVNIDKSDVYERYWKEDVVFPKEVIHYPSIGNDDFKLYGGHWTHSVIADAYEDEMPELVDYMFDSVIREYECFEVKDNGNFVKCRIKAEYRDMNNGSVEEWEIYCTLFVNEKGDKVCSFDDCSGSVVDMIGDNLQSVEIPDIPDEMIEEVTTELPEKVIAFDQKTESVYLKTSGESSHDDGSYHKKHQFTYNEYGELIKETVCDYDTMEEIYSMNYEYDENGNKTREEHRDSNGNPTYCYLFEYTDDKLIREESIYYDENGASSSVVLYEYGNNYVKKHLKDGWWVDVYYNDLDQMIAYNSYDAEGTVLAKIGYEYDEYGNETKRIDYSKDGTSSSVTLKEYTYDEEGRILDVYFSYDGADSTQHTSYGYDDNGNQTYVEYWDNGSYKWTLYQYELCTVKKR